MKARIENGQIKRYSKIPEYWKNHIGFDKLETAIHEAEGFFEVVVPVLDYDIQKLGEIYFDEINKLFTYSVIDLVLDIETIREQKHEEFTRIVEGEMTDALKIGVLEKLALGEAIPTETKDKVIALRERETEVKELIDSIQDAVILKKFSFDRTEIEADKEELKAARKL